MASKDVRNVIYNSVEAAANPWPCHDLSDYHSIRDVLANADAEVVLVQFASSDEQMVSIGGEGNQGWEETGVAVVHLIVPTGFPAATALDKADAIRLALRGSRPAPSVTIESVSPFVDFGADQVGVEGAWHGWAGNVFYVRRDCG